MIWKKKTEPRVQILFLEYQDQLDTLFIQTCHFYLTQNLNEYEKKSEYAEKNLNLTTKIALLYRNLYQFQRKIWILSQVIWISLNFKKKNLNNSDKIEWQVWFIPRV